MKPEFYVDAGGAHRWRVRGRQGRIVAECPEGYPSETQARHAFHILATGLALFLSRYGAWQASPAARGASTR